MQRAVAGDPGRPGVPRAFSPTAAGHARRSPAMSLSTGPSRLSSRWTCVSRRSISATAHARPAVTSSSCAGSSGSASAPVAVTIVWPMPAIRSAERRAGARVELGENVVEEHERRRRRDDRRAPRPRRGAARAPRAAARPASRTCAGRGRRHGSSRRRGAGRGPSTPRSRSRSSRASRAATVGGSPSYSSAAAGRPSSSARAANGGVEQRDRLLPRDSRAPRRASATCSVHGATASRVDDARRRRGAGRRFAARRRPRTRPAAARGPAAGGRATGRSTRVAPQGRPSRPPAGRA